MTTGGERELRWEWLGRVEYDEGLRLQEAAREAVTQGPPDRLLLLEHSPVYTLGRNADRREVVANADWRERHGIAVRETDRGGKVTYHGPGQLVGYPIFDLSPDRRDVRRYVRALQRSLVATLADFGVQAEARRQAPEIGVWVGAEKVASLGIHIRRWVTTHGFALNVTTDLSHFAGIVPCGLGGISMASIESLTGDRPDLEEVAGRAARSGGGGLRIPTSVHGGGESLMADRLLIVHVPAGGETAARRLLEGVDANSSWHQRTAEDFVLTLLVRGEEVETTMDDFERELGGREGFHLAVVPLEAWLPRPERETEEEAQGLDRAASGRRSRRRISRAELYAEIDEQLGVTAIFLTMTGLSAVVAALGLLRDNVAVIIGAMVIAPLLTPNIALALATTLADWKLARRALVVNAWGAGLAFALAAAIGWVTPVHLGIPAIADRLHLPLSDLALAVAAGAAGTLAFTRGYSGAVIGVMVAVALMPPLVVTGLLVGEGLYAGALRAGLLTAVNVIGINLAAVVTFVLQGLRPRAVWEAERARKASWIAATVWLLLLAALGALFFWLGEPDLPGSDL